MAGRNYQGLIAWQKAMDLAVAVYDATAAFPIEERYGLTSQVRRASVSIPSNVAEGQGRGTTLDFRRVLRIAHGSVRELETQTMLARRLDVRGFNVRKVVAGGRGSGSINHRAGAVARALGGRGVTAYSLQPAAY